MASQPSTRLRIELQAAGENLNTWGAPKLNTALQRLEDAVCGFYSATLSGAVSLSSANYSGDQAHYAVLNLTGGTGGSITIPSVEKTYFVRNATSGNVIITTGLPTTAIVTPGSSAVVMCDGSNCYKMQSADFAGSTVTSVGSPVNDTDAANKAYVVAQIMASALSGTLPGQGGNAGKFLQTNGTTVAWANAGGVWTAIASSVSLIAGSSNAVDTTAARALALPASPGASGNAIRVADVKGLAGTNNITVSPNGTDTMNGVAADTMLIDVAYGDVTFVPVAGGWQTVLQ